MKSAQSVQQQTEAYAASAGAREDRISSPPPKRNRTVSNGFEDSNTCSKASKRRRNYRSEAFRSWVTSCVVIIKGNEHGGGSSDALNGANGEATNSDDVELSPKEANDERVRNQKAASQRQHQKKLMTPRSEPDDMTRRQPGKPKLSELQKAENIAENKRILAERCTKTAAAMKEKEEKAARNAEKAKEVLSNEKVLEALPPAPKDAAPVEEFNVPVPKAATGPTREQRHEYDRQGKWLPDYRLTKTKLYLEVPEDTLPPPEIKTWGKYALNCAAASGAYAITSQAVDANFALCVVSTAFAVTTAISFFLNQEEKQDHSEFEFFKVTELVTRADPDDRKFKPLKKYGFNAVRETSVCMHAINKLKLMHPGMRPTAYSVNTFVYSLSSLYPLLTQEQMYDTATYYHQSLLARESVLQASTGRLVKSLEKI